MLITGANSTRNYGGSNSNYVGKDGNGEHRKSIIRFDLSELSSLSGSIESVTLTFTTIAESTLNNTNVLINLYQISNANAGWKAGTASGAVQTTASTWNNLSHNTVTWAGSQGLGTPGTDYLTTIINGTKTVTTGNSQSPLTVTGVTYTWTLPIALVEEWISGINAGLLLDVADFDELNSGDYVKFGSANHTTEAWRPYLTINYATIPEAGSVALVITGLVPLLLTRRLLRRKGNKEQG